MTCRTSRTPNRRPDAGYALLALIVALMVMAISLTTVAPDARIQAQREVEMEFYYAGDQMAEAIARYYNGGKLNPQGLVFAKTPYGPLTELRKLRDGVTIGNKDVRFVRASAYLDPITHEEWEPIRVGDPRIRKFLIAWSRSTGRPIPPAYVNLMQLAPASSSDIDDEDEEEDGEEGEDDETDGPVAPGGNVNPRPNLPPDESDEEDEEWDEDEEWEEDEEDGEDGEEEWEDEEDGEVEGGGGDGDEGDGGQALRNSSQEPLFVKASFQTRTPTPGRPAGRPSSSSRSNELTPTFGRDHSIGPIIGVVSRSKARAVKTRYGIEKHNEVIFIYMPPPPRAIVPSQGPGGPGAGQGGQGGQDRDGDGIPDGIKPTNPPGAGSQRRR